MRAAENLIRQAGAPRRFSRHIRKFLIPVLCLLCADAAVAQIKVGAVDMNRVFKDYRKTKDAEAKLNQAKEIARKEYDERAEAYKKALDEINGANQQLEAPGVSADAKARKTKGREEKVAALKKMEVEINDFRQTREHQLREQVQRMQEGIVREITAVVMDLVKAKNLDLVFDTSGASFNGFSPILFSPKSGDLTAEVIAVLNKPGEQGSELGAEKETASKTSPPAKPR